MNKKNNPVLLRHLVAIESDLQSFYQLPQSQSIADHLMPLEEMRSYMQQHAQPLHTDSLQRAAVLVEASTDEAFVGVGFDKEVVERLAAEPPLSGLRSSNLDIYCVLIEEVSHFTLLMSRMQEGRSVTRLELELQAEIDKVILCAATLERHYGKVFLAPLVRSLFDQSKVINQEDAGLYETANSIAARFWHRLASRWERHLPKDAAQALREALRNLFRQSLANKVEELKGSAERIIKAAA